MSKFLQPSLYNGRAAEQQWVNIVWNTHDQLCGCNKPFEHLAEIINNGTCHTFTKETTTAATSGTTKRDETGFDEGDLEALFAENQDDEG